MNTSFKHLARRAAGVVLWLACAALSLIARLRHGQEPYRPASVERILIIRLDLIGDLLFTVPAIRNTRQRFPHARLDVLVAPNTAPLLAECPYVDRVYTLDAHTLTHLSRHLLTFSMAAGLAAHPRLACTALSALPESLRRACGYH